MKRGALPPAYLALILGATACQRPDPGADTVEITIPPRATWNATLDTLTARGIVRSRLLFDIVGRVRKVPANLKTGTYEIRPHERYAVIIDVLTTGRGRELRLVVPEGLMLSEIAAIVERTLAIPRDSFEAAARDRELLAAFGIPAPTLEGYLYPETYHVPDGIDARRLVRLMIDEFESQWEPSWANRLETLDLTRHQLVTFASIVEGEVRVPEDRPFVSAVYHNRLRIGMPLQADPTVIYALGTRRRLFERDYRIEHPYNTYRIPGLPPGPIGSPGRASIEAALYPGDAPYLFFVAQPDGKHIFSRTLAEHNRARAQVREMQRAPSRRPAAAAGQPREDPARQ